MARTITVHSCCLTMMILLISSWYSVNASAHPAKNIIMIMVDDLRPALGCYGQPVHTPNIDKLLSRSVQFHNAHAQFALCGPSRTSLLTSRRPDTLTVFDQHKPYWRDLPGNFTSLPQYFKSASYHTVSLGKIFHPSQLSGNTHDDYPYSWSEPPYHASTHAYKNSKVCPGRDGELHANIVCPVNVSAQPEGTLPDIQIATEAAKRLRLLSSQQVPFLLAIGFHKPHIPLKYPQEYDELYNLSLIHLPKDNTKSPGLPNVAWNPFMDLKERDDVSKLNISFPYGGIPKDYEKQIIRSYYAATSYVDDRIGQVLAAVEKHNLWNNTIITLLADHGWSLGEHGEWSKYSNYDVATHVPLGIYVPPNTAQTATSHVYDMVELVDLFPTLVELAGFNPIRTCRDKVTTTCTEGRSLVPLIEGRRNGPKFNVSYSQYPRPSLQPRVNSDQPLREDIRYMGYSVKDTRYRYVVWISFNTSTMRANLTDVVAQELYDIYKDPAEDCNLMSLLPAVGRQLYDKLTRVDWMSY